MKTRKTQSPSQTMTLRLDTADLRRLDALSEATDRSKAWLAAQAVRAYLDLNEWQIRAIRGAVANANRRSAKFFTQEEVDAWLAAWGTAQERKPPR
ncbi:MAG: CopG family ribbon-helix-helix protein [bacterium]